MKAMGRYLSALAVAGAIALGASGAFGQVFQSLGSATLAVTTSTGNVALPAGRSGNNITIQNVGTVEAFINLGVGSGTVSTTANESVPASAARCFSAPNATYLAAITASSSTTLRVSQGSGPCSLSFRGGGGGGGGSGTVTDVAVATANGVSGSVATSTTTPIITLTLGAITPSSVRIGTVSTTTGSLQLANSASAFLTTIQAGNAAAARTYIWPTNFGAAGTVLTDAAGDGVLSWAAGGGGLTVGTTTITSGTTTRVLFNNAGTLGEYTISGTGSVAMTAGPTFTTPTLGVAAATTINKVALTAPATGSTLTIPDGVTLTGPASSGTAMTLGNAEAVSGIKTFATGQIVNGTLRLGTVSSVTGQLLLANSASANLTTIQAGNAAAARTYTWPTNFGAAGTVLTDAGGDGTLSWAAGGGGGSPGGSDTQVQFNDGGAFGGDAGLTFNKTTNALTVTGPVALTSAGSQGAPTLYVGGSATTGFYEHASGRTAFSWTGSQVLGMGGGFAGYGLQLPLGGTLEWAEGSTLAQSTAVALTPSAVGVLQIWNGTAGAALGFLEQTAPAAGAVNSARLYAKDNGSGKTQLCVIFNTGAEQCLATQP